MTRRLDDWICQELDLHHRDERMKVIGPALEILISRADEARRRGAGDPLVTITAKRAGGNSRACTKRMLEQLGLDPRSRRAVHRLLSGSPSGWAGLLRIYTENRPLTADERGYARRQLSAIDPGAIAPPRRGRPGLVASHPGEGSW